MPDSNPKLETAKTMRNLAGLAISVATGEANPSAGYISPPPSSASHQGIRRRRGADMSELTVPSAKEVNEEDSDIDPEFSPEPSPSESMFNIRSSLLPAPPSPRPLPTITGPPKFPLPSTPTSPPFGSSMAHYPKRVPSVADDRAARRDTPQTPLSAYFPQSSDFPSMPNQPGTPASEFDYSDISDDWAPIPIAEHTGIAHLPDWQSGLDRQKKLPAQSSFNPFGRSTSPTLSSNGRRANGRSESHGTNYYTTSPVRATRSEAQTQLSALPNPTIQQDVDFTLRALMNLDTFSRLLNDGLGRQRFREFLSAEGDTAELDFWTDTHHFAQSLDQVRSNGDAFRNLYLSGTSDVNVSLTNELRREILNTLNKFSAIDSSLGDTQTHLLHSMYHNQFHRFIKHKIIQETHVSLGSSDLTGEKIEGLGECFALTNPRMPDHPIVLVSDGFVAVTGYPKAQIIGRNCRFLQGPGTPPESVQRIRDGLNSGKGCTELLLNYRRNGEPFYCLLCIIPIRDAKGAIQYFIGGQTNVTGLLATGKDLGFLIGGDARKPTGRGSVEVNASAPAVAQPSPAMLLYKQHILSKSKSMSSMSVRSMNTGALKQAAGMAPSPLLRPSHSKSGFNGGVGFFKSMFGRSSAEAGGRQVLQGAESVLGAGGAKPLEAQMALFQDTYKKIMMFKQTKNEITFVTPELLVYLGFPHRSARDIFSSSLLHKDFTSLLTAGSDKNETKFLRAQVKEAVKNGSSLSIHCGLKVSKMAGVDHKFGMVHLTPMKDADGVSAAFVAVFG